MSSKGHGLADRLVSLGRAEPADYVSRRRDLVEEFISAIPSPASRDKLQALQDSVDQLRAVNGCTSHALPELLDRIRDSLQEIVILTDRLKQEAACD